MTMDPAQMQRERAIRQANDRRVAIKHLRARLAGDLIAAAHAIAEPTADTARIPLIQLVAMTRPAHAIASASIERLGHQAARDRVSLITALGRAGTDTRAWLIGEGLTRMHGVSSDDRARLASIAASVRTGSPLPRRATTADMSQWAPASTRTVPHRDGTVTLAVRQGGASAELTLSAEDALVLAGDLTAAATGAA
jgi:hypothetical protein